MISALTTGFASATISYDFDVDPANRKANPSFYGYLPDEGTRRLLVFMCMTVNSATLLISKSISLALLALIKISYLYMFLGTEMALYLAYTIVRRDFIYWAPVGPVISFPLSLLMRLFCKVVTDFTGCVDFRHPNELGGLYWSTSLFATQIFQ